MRTTFKSCSLATFKHNIVLLTIVTMLYIISLWLTYFETESLYLLTPSSIFVPPPPPHFLLTLAATNSFLVSVSLFYFWLEVEVLEKEMATHSSVLAWRIPGTGEPGGLPPMGSHRVGHDWSDLAAAAAAEVRWYLFVFLSLTYFT